MELSHWFEIVISACAGLLVFIFASACSIFLYLLSQGKDSLTETSNRLEARFDASTKDLQDKFGKISDAVQGIEKIVGVLSEKTTNLKERTDKLESKTVGNVKP